MSEATDFASSEGTSAYSAMFNATFDTTTAYNVTVNCTEPNVTSPICQTTTPFSGRLGFGTLEYYDEFWVGYYINSYYLWVISVIGVPGNLASVVVIATLKPVTSSSLYIAVLAIADSSTLCLKLVYHQITIYNVEMGDGVCKVLFVSMSTGAMFANWVLVAMTTERFVAVWLPLRVNQLCTKTNAIIVMSGSFIFLFFLNIQFAWSMIMVEDSPPSGIRCGYSADAIYFMINYWYWIDAAFYTIIPCIILFLCNGLIISGMNKARRMQRAMTGTNSEQLQEKNKQQRQISIMLISVSVVFVILTMPNAIYFAVKSNWTFFPLSKGHAQNILVEQIIFFLSDTNHAINFYMYFCTGKRFRNKALQLIGCRRGGRNKSSLYSSRYVTSLSQSNATNVSTLTSVSASKEL